jgi:hypothetical protein
MATTNSTANYNLPQWTADDKVGIMANLNPAFNTIDQKLHEAVVNADNASTVSSSASQVANSANTLANKVDGEMTEVQADILTLQNLVNSLQSRFADSLEWNSIIGETNSTVVTSTGATNGYIRKDLELMTINRKLTLKTQSYNAETMLFKITQLPKTERIVSGVATLIGTKNDNTTEVYSPLLKFKTDGSVVIQNLPDFSNGFKNLQIDIGMCIVCSNWYK